MELYFRPMGLGELLDRSLNLYRRNFLLFLGIVAIVEIPITLAQVLFTLLLFPNPSLFESSVSTAFSFFAYEGMQLILILVSIIGQVVIMSALAIAVSERYHEKSISLKQVYGRTLRRWDTLLLLLLIIGITNAVVLAVLFVPGILIAVLGAGGGSTAAGLAAFLGLSLSCLAFVPVVIAFIFLNTVWAFSFPAAMLENLTAIRALGRSWNLVSSHFWRVLGTLLILLLFIYGLIFGPTLLLTLLVRVVSISSLVLESAINTVASGLISLFVTPVQFAVLALLYYDIRIRKEGYDLQVRVDAMDVAPALDASAMVLPPSLTTDPGTSPTGV